MFSYYCLPFCRVACDLSSFILEFIYLGPFLFLFCQTDDWLINFVNSFKEAASGLIDLFSYFGLFVCLFEVVSFCFV